MEKKVVVYEAWRGVSKRLVVATFRTTDGAVMGWMPKLITDRLDELNKRPSKKSYFTYKVTTQESKRKRRAK